MKEKSSLLKQLLEHSRSETPSCRKFINSSEVGGKKNRYYLNSSMKVFVLKPLVVGNLVIPQRCIMMHREDLKG